MSPLSYVVSIMLLLVVALQSADGQCPDNPCGKDAMCRLNTAAIPVCSCPFGYLGDPFKECIRPECISDGDCTEFQGCRKGKCVDPCIVSCGTNAECRTVHHVPICSCPAGYTGSPFERCDPL
ncbi:dumpy [Anopheles darlingi]|uniref:Dumpy n=1 Tax=Anopheles darlingi TaxID=43151 RepID=W5JEH3_ANODA|nr:delta-like protein 4 isoform X2 [Anopheles darlingi]ETN62757.1 dumpy [Anopheles darlingi]